MSEINEIPYLVSCGKNVELESVDFSDPNRFKTCLETDFPILAVNQVSAIEGNAGKPIYQMSKWWARRRSSVFRTLLIAAATKAPDEESEAAKFVWDNYYANHQQNDAFKELKVADIFMGGGTTLVEGSRLGMQMFGNDLNPVAWFVVKQQFSDVDLGEVKRLMVEIEERVRPQIIPFYFCDGPNGEKGKWTKKSTNTVMGDDFDPLSLKPEDRNEYSYEGPEIIYSFWAKHAPCQKKNCNHITPLIPNSTISLKSLSVNYWEHECNFCGCKFDIEKSEARIAPDVPLILGTDSKPYTVLGDNNFVSCPECGKGENLIDLKECRKKRVQFSLLLHPEWLSGSSTTDNDGNYFGGSPQDGLESTQKWNLHRSEQIQLLEVRGELPATIFDPINSESINSGKNGGTIPKRSTFQCSFCGLQQDIRTSISQSKKGGPVAGYAIQGFSPGRSNARVPYNGRFFAPFSSKLAKQYNSAIEEWEIRKDEDLAQYWPRTEVPFGFMTGKANGDIRKSYGFTHWWTMFNPRQLLVLTQILKAIVESEGYDWKTREYVLGAFQQYVRNQNMFCFWNSQGDKLEPHLSNNNFHPKMTVVENCVFHDLGRGNWRSACEGIIAGREWSENPWEIVSVELLKNYNEAIAQKIKGKSVKVYPGDTTKNSSIIQASSTDLTMYEDNSLDLIITDPPFGGLLHYSELADFFHVWLQIPLKDVYPNVFGLDYTPKSMEVVANKAREPIDPDRFYQRLLTACWKESYRILKSGGLLAFTFHHSEDDPWVAVLESLFEAGFYLVATYPIRSDETKGQGEFGSKMIEYDIVHVCRKRESEPTPVSWARMRKEVLSDVNHIKDLLKNHEKGGLPSADLQVIRRGKALEYYSRHYGKVMLDVDKPMNVKQALVGINQLIDEDIDQSKELPPAEAEPITRQFLRIFDGKSQLARDQLQKLLKGSGIVPDYFMDRGWITLKRKIYHFADPKTFANSWYGKQKKRLTSDLDQALVLIGACYEDSGINAADTLKSVNFKPHPALGMILDWISRKGHSQTIRVASKKSLSIYGKWAEKVKPEEFQKQLELFGEELK